MVGEKAEGRGLLEGGCPASNGAEFGRMRWTEVRGISERIRDGFWLGFGWIQARSWAVSAREEREGLQESWVRLGSEFGEVFGSVSGSGSLWKEERKVGGSLVGFRGRMGRSLARDCPLESLLFPDQTSWFLLLSFPSSNHSEFPSLLPLI